MFGDDRKSEFKMAVVKIGSTYISACGRASNAISNHNTTFSGSGNSAVPLPKLLHVNGSRNSRWRSSKPEVLTFQLVEELATRFQIIIPRFSLLSCVTITCTSGDLSASGLAVAIWIYHFRLDRTVL